MINLRDGELIDILPEELSKEPTIRAISRALKQAYQAFYVCQAETLVYAFIAGAPEYVLDLLLPELRVTYTTEALDLDKKRSLAMNTMLIKMKDGTAWAVNRLLDIIYGEGSVSEWYDYSGTPGHFKLVIRPEKTADINLILSIIDTAKRLTAKLDSICLQIEMEQETTTAIVQYLTLAKTYPDEPAWSWPTLYVDEENAILADESNNILIEEA